MEQLRSLPPATAPIVAPQCSQTAVHAHLRLRLRQRLRLCLCLHVRPPPRLRHNGGRLRLRVPPASNPAGEAGRSALVFLVRGRKLRVRQEQPRCEVTARHSSARTVEQCQESHGQAGAVVFH